ncbi:hypothetical protein AC062_1983 [Pasteurellaceae bacterium NI1060]|nr:hypothetical protein AC062_1983 [Pasteurellaceae bacterium NI1060]
MPFVFYDIQFFFHAKISPNFCVKPLQFVLKRVAFYDYLRIIINN